MVKNIKDLTTDDFKNDLFKIQIKDFPFKNFDERNNIIEKDWGNGFKEFYEYDENNNLILFKDTNGYEKKYTYKKIERGKLLGVNDKGEEFYEGEYTEFNSQGEKEYTKDNKQIFFKIPTLISITDNKNNYYEFNEKGDLFYEENFILNKNNEKQIHTKKKIIINEEGFFNEIKEVGNSYYINNKKAELK